MLFGWSNEGDEMGGVCGMFGGEEKRMFGFGGDAWKKEQYGHCAHNIVLKRVPATIVTGENNKYYTTLVCVFVAIFIQHDMSMNRIVVCGLPRSTMLFHIIS
jgi:hypothetical protein